MKIRNTEVLKDFLIDYITYPKNKFSSVLVDSTYLWNKWTVCSKTNKKFMCNWKFDFFSLNNICINQIKATIIFVYIIFYSYNEIMILGTFPKATSQVCSILQSSAP